MIVMLALHRSYLSLCVYIYVYVCVCVCVCTDVGLCSYHISAISSAVLGAANMVYRGTKPMQDFPATGNTA